MSVSDHGRFRSLLLASTALGLMLGAHQAEAQMPRAATKPPTASEQKQEGAFDFEANELEYDRDLGILKAVGQVEIVQGERILKADTVTYNERTDVMAASGHVTLLEPNGEVLFAEYVELTADMKKGMIKNMLIILQDKSRIAALKGERKDGNETEMSRTIYTACSLCEKDPKRPPLWQLKAIKVIHDKKRQTIEYKDAWLEVAGFPVAYTPYFIHPDPTVKRRSGFLPPSIGSSSELGTIARIPYFWAISDQTDSTITPFFSSEEGPGLHTEIRHRMLKGRFDLDGSVAVQNDSDDDAHGHVDAEFRYDLDKTWRTGFDAQRTVEDTYTRRYGYGFDQTLTSRAFIEGFRGRNYMAANSYVFQSLEAGDVDEEIPVVLPMLDYHHLGEPDAIGGYTELRTNLTSLMRSDGADTRRLSIHGGWHLPLMGPFGTVMGFNTMLRSDIYHKSNFTPTDESQEDNGFEYRFMPEASLDMAYPLSKTEGNYTQIIEPQAQFIISPYGGNSSHIPNEDSQTAELDDTRLFSHSRYSGFDRVEGGPRVNYGLRWGIFGLNGGSTTAFLGQSYRLKEDGTFGQDSGLETKLSDLVGKVHIKPGEAVDLLYRTRMDKDDFEFKRNEVELSAGKPLFRFSTQYSFFAAQSNNEFAAREEITYTASSQFTEYWRGQVSGTNDLDDGGDLRYISTSLTYEDECLAFTTEASRSFYEDRELRPSDQIVFRLSLKTLGDFATSADP